MHVASDQLQRLLGVFCIILDEPFNFLYEDKDNNDNDEDVDEDDICELVVNKGHAIAFTDELFHAGGDNSTKTEIYRLFAYVVNDENDYPNNMVFTKKQGKYDKAKCG